MDSKAIKKAITIFLSLAVAAMALFLTVQIPKLKLDVPYSKSIDVEAGTEFEDSGAQLYWGNHKIGDKIYSKTEVNSKSIGEYKLTYERKFFWRRAKKTVSVSVKDTQAPKIELISKGDYTQPGNEYSEEGFRAYDIYDGDLTRFVEKRIEGKTIYYTIEDSSGNKTQATRTIRYDDKDAPTITLNGANEVTIFLGDKFVDPGFTAIDNVDGDLTNEVITQNNIDTNTIGTYEVEYKVKDSSENEAVKHRKVTVKEKISKPIKEVEPNGKVIYLTFDDGPSRHTPRLLNILRKYNVKATFFVVGKGELQYLDDIAKDGHSIGLHTMTHDYAKVYSSEQEFMKEITELRRIVYNRTGIDTTMIRFPGGSSNTISRRYNSGIMTRLVNRITAQGYQYYDWNVTSGDAGEVNTAWAVYNNVITGVQYQKTSIVLQHDSKGFSVDATEDIIKWGLANGYTFRKLTPNGPTVHHGVNN